MYRITKGGTFLRASSHEQCKCKHEQTHAWTTTTQPQMPMQEMENFSFPCTCISFHTCEPGQRKGKPKCKMKNTLSMPPRFTFKPRWHPPPPFLILFSESLFPDCWSRVNRTLGTRLPPSWDTEIRVHISFCLHLHFMCDCHLYLLLHLHCTCEPVLSCDPKFADCKTVRVF